MREFINIVEGPTELGYTVPAYHGTEAPFPAFRMEHRTIGSSGSREGPLGIWFTNSEETARSFAEWAARKRKGGHLMPVVLRMDNPWIPADYDEIRDLVDRHTKFDRPNYVIGGRQIRMVQDKVDYAAARAELRAKGFDSIMLKNTTVDSQDGKPIDQYVVFEPNSVRLRDARFEDPASEDLMA